MALEWGTRAERPDQECAPRRPSRAPSPRRRGREVPPGIPARVARGSGRATDARRGARPGRRSRWGRAAAGRRREGGSRRPRCAVIVVDASIVAAAFADDGPDGDRARGRLRGERLCVPELTDLEVASVWRRALRSGRLDERRARLALDDLAAAPIVRAPHGALLPRIWELRQNLTPYDAAYVALAEALEAPLLTADRRLARAPGLGCEVELLRSGP